METLQFRIVIIKERVIDTNKEIIRQKVKKIAK